MKFPSFLKVFGDQTYRSPNPPKEEAEQITFINWLRQTYPDTLGAIAVHIKNEGKRTKLQIENDKMNGLTAGAPDVMIPGAPSLLIEIKRKDCTKSCWQPAQLEYLKAAHDQGAFVCVALGHEAAKEAVQCYLKSITSTINAG